MGKRIRLKRGDIYRFDLDDQRHGLGQVIEPGGVFYTTVLRTPVAEDFELADVDASDVLLCGWTRDAFLFHGRWQLVGNLPVPEEAVPKPNSKVEISGEKWVADYLGQPLRSATDFEWDRLDHHSSYAPITFENAFKAHYGCAAAEPHHDKISIDRVRDLAAIRQDSIRTRLRFRWGRRRAHPLSGRSE
jgi:hypothetical protein